MHLKNYAEGIQNVPEVARYMGEVVEPWKGFGYVSELSFIDTFKSLFGTYIARNGVSCVSRPTQTLLGGPFPPPTTYRHVCGELMDSFSYDHSLIVKNSKSHPQEKFFRRKLMQEKHFCKK